MLDSDLGFAISCVDLVNAATSAPSSVKWEWWNTYSIKLQGGFDRLACAIYFNVLSTMPCT